MKREEIFIVSNDYALRLQRERKVCSVLGFDEAGFSGSGDIDSMPTQSRCNSRMDMLIQMKLDFHPCFHRAAA